MHEAGLTDAPGLVAKRRVCELAEAGLPGVPLPADERSRRMARQERARVTGCSDEVEARRVACGMIAGNGASTRSSGGALKAALHDMRIAGLQVQQSAIEAMREPIRQYQLLRERRALARRVLDGWRREVTRAGPQLQQHRH